MQTVFEAVAGNAVVGCRGRGDDHRVQVHFKEGLVVADHLHLRVQPANVAQAVFAFVGYGDQVRLGQVHQITDKVRTRVTSSNDTNIHNVHVLSCPSYND